MCCVQRLVPLVYKCKNWHLYYFREALSTPHGLWACPKYAALLYAIYERALSACMHGVLRCLLRRNYVDDLEGWRGQLDHIIMNFTLKLQRQDGEVITLKDMVMKMDTFADQSTRRHSAAGDTPNLLSTSYDGKSKSICMAPLAVCLM